MSIILKIFKKKTKALNLLSFLILGMIFIRKKYQYELWMSGTLLEIINYICENQFIQNIRIFSHNFNYNIFLIKSRFSLFYKCSITFF